MIGMTFYFILLIMPHLLLDKLCSTHLDYYVIMDNYLILLLT